MADPATFVTTWFTPSSLFIFVNLVIGTIAITYRLANNTPQNHPQLHRSPSLLDRVRSFNLTRYNNHHESSFVAQTEPQLVRSSSLLERISSFNLTFRKHQPTHAETEYAQPLQPEPENPELVQIPSFLQRLQSSLYRSDSVHREDYSDRDPVGDDSDNLEKRKAEMRKSTSEKAGSMKMEWEEKEETVERRRPATARGKTASWREDEEVDVKADDFINRFKKQLRLQRLESLICYREKLSGGN